MNYEESVKIWAAQKWNLDLHTIEAVVFDQNTESWRGCETCDYGGGSETELCITVHFRPQTVTNLMKKKKQTKTKTIRPPFQIFTIDNFDFGQVVSEIVETANQFVATNW